MALFGENRTKSGLQSVLRGVYREKKDERHHLISPKCIGVDDQSLIALLSPKTAFLARHLWIVFSNYL